jgi:hypothetical protein
MLFHGKIAKEFLRLFDIGHFNNSSIFAGAALPQMEPPAAMVKRNANSTNQTSPRSAIARGAATSDMKWSRTLMSTSDTACLSARVITSRGMARQP